MTRRGKRRGRRGMVSKVIGAVKKAAGYTLVASGAAAIAGPPIIAAINDAMSGNAANIPRDMVYQAAGVDINTGAVDSNQGPRIVRYIAGIALIAGGAWLVKRYH